MFLQKIAYLAILHLFHAKNYLLNNKRLCKFFLRKKYLQAVACKPKKPCNGALCQKSRSNARLAKKMQHAAKLKAKKSPFPIY
jgi:hypothetical protein